MGVLDRLFKKQANSALFSFLWGTSAPDMKGVDYLKAYKGWVYTCVNAIAEEVANVELHLIRKAKRGDTEIDNHIALNLLNDVNPFMSSGELILSTQAFLELDGNSFWYLPKGNVTKKPAEIWLLDPTRTLVVKSQQNVVGGYVYRNEKGQNVPLDPSEVIHFKRFNPLNRFRGIGTVQAAALAIDIDTYSAQWNRNFFYNSAIPSGALEMDGTLTQEQYDRLKARWASQYQGVDNAHRFAILEGGLKYKPITMTQKEMDFLEQRRFSRDEILGIFRVPKTALLITEDVNRANAEATDYVFAKRVIKPRMQFVVDRLNEFYLPLFGETSQDILFTFADPVPQNVELDLKRKETGLRAGYYTINEVREEEGKEPVQGGDVIYQPISMMPIGPTKEPSSNTPKTLHIAKSLAEKRVRFITIEIRKRKDEFYKILLDQKAFVLKRIKSFKSIKKDKKEDLLRLLFEGWDDWIGILLNPTDDALRTSLNYAGKQAVAQVGVAITFDLLNDRVVSWLRENALQHATSVIGSVKDEIAQRVVSGVEQGLGAQDIADAISEFFDDQSEWRALRIARTEVISGYAQGSIEGYKQSGIVTGKEWLTAQDDRVDEECAMNESDGIISLDASFSSGDDAPPVHPNCRCVLQPAV